MVEKMKSYNLSGVVILLLLAPSSLLVEALQVTTNNIGTSKDGIGVWDNVIPPSLCNELHIEASESGLGHKAFSRPILDTDKSNRPIIELVLDDILTKLEDGSNSNSANNGQQQFVEYWTRQEWRHIEAHADVDENLAKEQDSDVAQKGGSNLDLPFRYPSNGHVLYLKVGKEVQGPTCLFPNRSSGGDLLTSTNSGDDGSSETLELVTVPAVEGRLLRFDGSTIHAVPRPADLWFLPFVRGAAQYKPEENWGRSVILFNTWFEDPPKSVPLDEARRIVSGDNQNWELNSSSDRKVNEVSEWEVEQHFLNEDDSDEGLAVCNEQEFGRPAKVWLLGNERRRRYGLRTIKLNAPEGTRNAFLESHSVSRIKLYPHN